MTTKLTCRSREQLWVAVGVCCAVVAWTYSAKILWPWERFGDESRGALTSTLGDFYSRWAGTRALLIEHKDPYGQEVSREIKAAFYGKPITQPYSGSGVVDEQRFAYPVYVAFLVAPTAWLPFATAQKWMGGALAVLVGLSLMVGFEIVEWRSQLTAVGSTFFVLATPQVAQALRLRQLGIVVGFLILVAAWCAKKNYLLAAGAALAFSTIKPQMAALPLAWFLIWSVGNVRERWRLLAGFAGTLGILVGAGELVLPGWIAEFVRGVDAYRKYAGSSSLLEFALGSGLGRASVVLVVGAILWWGWRNRSAPSDSRRWMELLSSFLIANTIAMPVMTPFNQVLLILPALLVAQNWSAVPKAVRFVLLSAITFPWIAEALLLVFPPHVRSLSWQPLVPSALVLAVPFLLALAQAGLSFRAESKVSAMPKLS
jgi:hypothetical protein